MHVLSITPVLFMLAMSWAQGQSTPAASPPPAAKASDPKTAAANPAPAATPATPAPAAAKPADVKNPDPKNTAQPATNAAKPVAAADPKKPAAAPSATPAKADAAKSPPAAGAAAGAAPNSLTKTADAEAVKPAKPEGQPCVVAEFRAIGMGVQDVVKRRAQAQTWLKQRAKQCSVEQLLMIRNNRSQWMGTADSAVLAITVDSLLEAMAADNPRIAALLYGTPPPPPPPSGDEKQ